jgi:NitT/TauT family transport system substrate-binding protein
MCALPFDEIERQSGKIRTILNSHDVLGSPLISAVAFTTQKFEDENPNVAKAISEAFDQAMDFITKNPEQAAEIYNKHEPQKQGVPFILKMMDPNGPDQLRYSSAPKAFKAMADFQYKSGNMKTQVSSWKDFFVERAWSKDGS